MTLSNPFALGVMSDANEVEAQAVPRLRPFGATLGMNGKAIGRRA